MPLLPTDSCVSQCPTSLSLTLALPSPAEIPPKTIAERTARVHAQGPPYTISLPTAGLSQSDRTLWANAHFARTPTLLRKLPNKAQRDAWKAVNDASLPLRATPTETAWGRDRFGADLGEYTPEQFAKRSQSAVQLAALEVQSRAFTEKREREKAKWVDHTTHEALTVKPNEVEEEKLRRKEIASLRMELYGQRSGAYASDPEWDDVIPMPVEDGEGALAAIAYPEDYAEGMPPLTTFNP